MSRSLKHTPMMAICGGDSAKQDKRIAARGMRRKQNQVLRATSEFDDLLLPHRYECPWNSTYSWSRDGGQIWQGLTAKDEHYWYADEPFPPHWYVRMMRK